MFVSFVIGLLILCFLLFVLSQIIVLIITTLFFLTFLVFGIRRARVQTQIGRKKQQTEKNNSTEHRAGEVSISNQTILLILFIIIELSSQNVMLRLDVIKFSLRFNSQSGLTLSYSLLVCQRLEIYQVLALEQDCELAERMIPTLITINIRGCPRNVRFHPPSKCIFLYIKIIPFQGPNLKSSGFSSWGLGRVLSCWCPRKFPHNILPKLNSIIRFSCRNGRAKLEKYQKTARKYRELSNAMEIFVDFLGDEVQGPITQEKFISIIKEVHKTILFFFLPFRLTPLVSSILNGFLY